MTEQSMGVDAAHAELIDQVRQLLAGHPASSRIRLMFTPEGVDMAPGQALTPRASSDGKVELQPVAWSEQPPAALPGPSPHACESRTAATVVNSVWREVLKAGGPKPAGLEEVVVRGALDPAWLETLPLPIENRPQTQSVALANDIDWSPTDFDRFEDEEAMRSAYREQARTRVYEIFNRRTDGWCSLACRQLTRLAGCLVEATVYDSNGGDGTIGEHRDLWYGAILQVRGEKLWDIRPNRQVPPRQIRLQAGDLLLLPYGVFHDVSTPKQSTHVVFAFLTDRPLDRTRPA